MLGANFPNWFTMPRKRQSSETFEGCFVFFTAVVLLGSGDIPSGVIMWPIEF